MCKARLTFTIQTILNVSRITGATLGALGITAGGVLIADIHSTMSDGDQAHNVTTHNRMFCRTTFKDKYLITSGAII